MPAANAVVYEIHEDRIQALENNMAGTTAQLARQATQLEHIDEKVSDMKEDVENKLHEGFHSVKEEVRRTHDKVTDLHNVVKDHAERISKVESDQDDSKQTFETVKKTLIFIAVAVGGAMLDGVGQRIWSWLAR